MCSPASPPVLSSDEMIFLMENHDELKRLTGLCETQKHELQDLKEEIDEGVLKGKDVIHETAQMSQLSRIIGRNTARLSVLHEQIAALSGKQEFVEPSQLDNQAVEEPPQGVGLQFPFTFGPQESEWIYPNPNACKSSRRVILTGLPGSTSIIQVADAVVGEGGLVSIFLNPEPTSRDIPGYMTAMVEFNIPQTAEAFVEEVKEHGLCFIDVEGLYHQVTAKQTLSPSHPITRGHPCQFGVPGDGGSGRSIVLPNFPEQAIWALFKKFGVRHIIRASYKRNEETLGGKLNIEFTSIFQSTRFVRFITQGGFSRYSTLPSLLGLGTTPSDSPVSELDARLHTAEHVDPLELETLWNKPDFNMFKEHVQTPQFGEPIPRRPVNSCTTIAAPSTTIQLLELFQDRIKTRRVDRSMIHASLMLDLAEYILVDVTIYSCHNLATNTYVRDQGIDLAEFKARTVLDEQYAHFWHIFTQRTGFDIRRFYAYAEVAAWRREENERLGLPPWDAGDILRFTAPAQNIYAYAYPYLIQDVIDTSN
ncbi:uncharacterized protein B0J16DRAFT_397477 [Fusarium flagelliforme]|uniref:Uncharacterized protein n=1 Tax=Fusarium flagelliforme TaxID=2675880 RepID=A0A395MQA7_9HYPO|nr:uncharacterized protein B0J16DRAFT_397477 [Fusarium flagelliforme]KAH7189538.1 hypothetical protein B0J16DRAFT_397477 [Fusarium flagelliforme]RFN50106.1 hypothetical protein FIE12Z_5634 [Fusarium flagelliforme]